MSQKGYYPPQSQPPNYLPQPPNYSNYSQPPHYPPPPPQAQSYYDTNQQPYYQNYENHESNYESHPVKSPVGEKWVKKPKFQDLWAAILFFIHFVGFIAASYFGLKELTDTKALENDVITTQIRRLAPPILYSGLIGFFLSPIYMVLMHKFPKPLIVITLWLTVALNFLAAALYVFFRAYVYAIIFVIFAILYLICAISWRSRIPFAAILLRTVTSITKKYYGTLVISFVGLLFQLGWIAWCAITVYGWIQRSLRNEDCSTANGRFQCKNINLYLMLVFIAFSFYWTSQVIKMIVHVTDCGAYASYYFLHGTPQGAGSTPTLSSLKRACTTSFGSVCFGSLIIALLNTLKAILNIAANSDDDGIFGFVAACFLCLLSLIESLVEYFNYYAYIQVAIYGKSFYRAAKDTWSLVKEHGIDAIINDNLVGNVLATAAILIGAIGALFGFLYIRYIQPSSAGSNQGLSDALVVILSFIFGFTLTSVTLQPITSGVSTIFVALAEDPEALKRTNPELYDRIRQTWPEVLR